MLDDTVFSKPPYGLSRPEKQAFLSEQLLRLTRHHAAACASYGALLQTLGVDADGLTRTEDIPALPVRLFKRLELRSVPPESVVRVMTSSGTTSQQPSRIYLDKVTARYLTKGLAAIMMDFLGRKRLPMIVVDTRSTLRGEGAFSARSVGVLGMSNFGRNHFFLLSDDLKVDRQGLRSFLTAHEGQPLLIFGFTFMVWRHLMLEVLAEEQLDLSQAVLVHSGGWKKMKEIEVGAEVFAQRLEERSGLTRIHNFYGMVEQVGSVYMTCEQGWLHTPDFSDVVIRDPLTWSEAPRGEQGVIEVRSILPLSYPGHLILTEDLGTVLGEDECPCGRKGKYFQVAARIETAEVRGCSDVYDD